MTTATSENEAQSVSGLTIREMETYDHLRAIGQTHEEALRGATDARAMLDALSILAR